MSSVDAEFSWPRAHHFELKPPTAPHGPVRRRVPRLLFEPRESVDPTRGTLASGERQPDRGSIIQRGTGCDLLRPLSADRELCLKFASLDRTPAACLKFATNCGFLEKRPAVGAAETLNSWYLEIERMSTLIKNAKAGPLPIQAEGLVIAFGHIVLRAGPHGPTISTRPATLLGALWLQLGQHLAGAAALMNCGNCGGWFAGGGTGGRRRIARFCSTTCKNNWHNARRTMAGA
jgi:hypothetical protein